MDLEKTLFEEVYRLWDWLNKCEKWAESGNELDKRLYDNALTEWSALRGFVTKAGLADEYVKYLQMRVNN